MAKLRHGATFVAPDIRSELWWPESYAKITSSEYLDKSDGSTPLTLDGVAQQWAKIQKEKADKNQYLSGTMLMHLVNQLMLASVVAGMFDERGGLPAALYYLQVLGALSFK